MQLLTVLTLIYAAILVLALAVSLIGIFVALRRVSGALREVREALASVPDNTAPLAGVLGFTRDTAAAAARDVDRTRTTLERADERLTAIGARADVAELTG